jgi:transcriptional regulator with XRE-family HTH domain
VAVAGVCARRPDKKEVSMPETFGEALAALRATRPGAAREQLSQSELAKRAGLDHSYISRLENDRRAPSRDAVLRLGRVLEATPADLDRLLLAAGYAPDDPVGLLADEPEFVAAWRYLRDPAVPDRDRADLREMLAMLVRQFARRRGGSRLVALG